MVFASKQLFAALFLVCVSCAAPVDAPAADGGSPVTEAAPEIVGIAFQPLRSRTRSGDAVPHMELTGLLFLPEDQGLLLWDKSGRISHHALSSDGLVQLGELRLDGVYNNDDCGLISVALDPDWQDNGYLYAAACSSATHSTVTRYVFRPGDYAVVSASAIEVISFGDPSAPKPWHNVGSIGFFPDQERSMWILVGEKALPESAQDLSTELGSVLRILPSRSISRGGYSPHPDNLFFFGDTRLAPRPELYAWGLRSPWRGSVDTLGRLWVGDVGDELEEINLVHGAGDNFGWNAVQGGCHDAACSGMLDPLVYWGREADHHYRVEDPDATPAVLRVAWVGVPYAENAADPYRGFLDGTTLISDMCIGFVRAVGVDGEGKVARDQHVGHLAGLSGAAQGPDGYLYVTSYGGCTSDSEGVGGRVLRVVPRLREAPVLPPTAATPGVSLADEPLGPMPQQLSEAGFFEDMYTRRPIARAVSYVPSLPLWTNGAEKERWLLLPVGTQVDNGPGSGSLWELPIGAIFGKTFTYETELGSEPVETRVMRRTPLGWEYHAYKWVDHDAELLSLERSISVPVLPKGEEQLWHAVPSRFECRTCHESNATPVIGFDELRLNAAQPGAAVTQLEMLYERGVLRELPSAPESLVADDEITAEVLGYLHGNCAHCHNRSAQSMSALSLQHTDALSQLLGMQTQGSGQVPGIRVQPGLPEQSVLYRALVSDGTEPELKPMPPLGVQRHDRAAAALIERWIRGLPSL